MLKERNSVITNTKSSKGEKRKGKFVSMQAMRAYGGVQILVHSFFKAQSWVEVSGKLQAPTALIPGKLFHRRQEEPYSLTGSERRIFGSPARNIASISTTVRRLPHKV